MAMKLVIEFTGDNEKDILAQLSGFRGNSLTGGGAVNHAAGETGAAGAAAAKAKPGPKPGAAAAVKTGAAATASAGGSVESKQKAAAALSRVHKEISKEKAVEMLGEFGATKWTELPADKYDAFTAACLAAISGGGTDEDPLAGME